MQKISLQILVVWKQPGLYCNHFHACNFKAVNRSPACFWKSCCSLGVRKLRPKTDYIEIILALNACIIGIQLGAFGGNQHCASELALPIVCQLSTCTVLVDAIHKNGIFIWSIFYWPVGVLSHLTVFYRQQHAIRINSSLAKKVSKLCEQNLASFSNLTSFEQAGEQTEYFFVYERRWHQANYSLNSSQHVQELFRMDDWLGARA